ncbi:P-TEFb-associated cyclin-dependent protein kinase Cdk9 [Mayamaea pseudoterrestris]|nr:P-TEFb-associated cyclin-dependent protein kinase Cdk9 [Mayamaea pseudoterrestris]
MSSGTLPKHKYHRASQLGAGSFGSVVVVYNDDGEEYALKRFMMGPDDDSDQDGSHKSTWPVDIGVLRELSALRLLREKNGHVNITHLVDIQTGWGSDSDDCDDDDAGTDKELAGAGTSGCICIALPLYKFGSLQDALERRFFCSCSRKVKATVVHGLLSAVAFLHDNRIIHRDIKPNNIMLQEDDGNGWRPVLIDFSLAKIMPINEQPDSAPMKHTGEVGTTKYVSPEIVAREPYGLPSDLWSVGVVVLELLTDDIIIASKDRHAFSMIHTKLEQLDNGQPFPNLMYGLLRTDPNDRLTARQALQHALFGAKFHLEVPPVRVIDIAVALPLQLAVDDSNDNKHMPIYAARKKDRVLNIRRKRINQICYNLDATSPSTSAAAYEYSRVLEQLDDTLDESDAQGLLHCIVLAHRFFEVEVLDLEQLDENDRGAFANWSLDDYVDEESTLLIMLDYCLYERGYYK